jgi:antitoxin component YwqK of YwqJK toxin-antitoxin module
VKKLRKTINYVNIRNEVAYEVNSDTPYTGLYRGLKPDVYDDHTSALFLDESAFFVGEFKNGLREGKCSSYRDGQKQEEANYLDGKLVGKFTKWHDTGQKQEEGNLLDGKMVGKYNRWYLSGKKLSEGYYKDGKKDSKYTIWYDTGQKQKEANYLNGKLVGKFTQWYDTGQKQEEGNYLDGKEAGKHTRWYDTGQKQKEANYLDGKLVGKSTQWHRNGGKKGALPTYPEENKRPECILCGTALLLSFIFYCVYVFIDKVFGVLF